MKDYSFLRRTPIVRLLIPFVAGILLATLFEHQFSNCPLLLYSLPAVGFIFFIVVRFSNKLSFLFTPIIVLIITSLAINITIFRVKVPTNFENEGIWQGIIYENPLLKNNSILIPIKLISKNSSLPFPHLQPKAYLYTSKDTILLNQFRVGQRITFKGKLHKIENFKNPDEFNYQRFLKSKGVIFQSYIPSENIITSSSKSLIIKHFANNLQLSALNKFKSNINDPDALALISALSIGYKDYLSEEIEQSFANTGAIHVLAVSGLHVGIIYIFLSFFFQFFNNTRWQKITKTTSIIIIIWLYALLTGLSPSVTRAAIMFSLFGIGKLLHRDTSFFNTLALAALILLAYNPLLLFNVGFQLSFTAVAGIVYYQPKFYKWYSFQNRFLDKVYKLFTVSLAAQLVTTPLCLYYFHQFPTYFWLTNILLILFVFILLIGTVFFLLLSWIPLLGIILSYIIELLLKITYWWVEFIEQLPLAVIRNIFISKIEVLLLFLLIFSITRYFVKKRSSSLIYIISIIIIWISIDTINDFTQRNNNKIIIYNLPQLELIGIYSPTKNILLQMGDSVKLNNAKKFYLYPHWNKICANNVDISNIDSIKTPEYNDVNKLNTYKKISLANTETLFLINNSIPNLQNNSSPISYFYICSNIMPPEYPIYTETIILGNTLKPYKKAVWNRYANEHKIQLLDLKEYGALEINIE